MNEKEISSIADFLINKYGLVPHPEGGYFREVYRSMGKLESGFLPDNFDEDHVYSTAIYFMLKSGQFSKFHKLKQDEIWHFYYGHPLVVIFLEDNGNIEEHILSNMLMEGHTFHALMPANTWIAAYPLEKESFSLVGCTVAPGFEFSDFELAKRDELIKKHPQHEELIKTLT